MYSNMPLLLLFAPTMTVFGFPTELSPVDPSLLFDRAIGSSCSTPVRLMSLSSTLRPLTYRRSMVQEAAKTPQAAPLKASI